MQSVILVCQILTGFLSGRFFLCYFRRIKTGKLDLCVGDRFRQDNSEPKFGGVAIAFTLVLGICIGVGMSGFSGSNYTYSLPLVFLGIALALMLTAMGSFQDYMKETERGIGFRGRYLVAGEYILFVGFLLLKQFFGFRSQYVLLPFHLGFINFGRLYIPLVAGFMTLTLNLVKIHDCQGGATKNSVQGLCTLDCLIYALGISAAGTAVGIQNEGMLFAVCTAGACSGFLIWNISPSKMYTGESGGLLLGGLCAILPVLSGMEFVFFISGIVFIIDGVCALIQYLVFKLRKKLVFKGLTLHGHLKALGWSDYRIMGLSALVSVLCSALTIWFFVYSGKIIIR